MKDPRRPKRRRRVKQLNSSFKLLGTGLQVLKSLGAGNTASETSKALHCSKANITYWKNKLLSTGALRLQTKDVIQIFSLTPFGSKLVTRSEGFVLGEVVCLEDYAVKFGVLEWEKRRIVWEKLGEPRNWVKLGCRIGGVRVVKTSDSIIIHPGPLKGFDDKELLMLAGRIVEWVKRILEDKFGMILSDDGTPLHLPIIRFYSEEAKEDVKNGTIIVEGVGSIDNSPPEKVPHEEYNGTERAHARLLLPDSVKRLEMKVDSLTKITESLVTSTTRLVDLLQGMLQPSQPSGLERDVGKYVT
jgi:hypothetical protein